MASAASFNLMLGFFWIKFPVASWMSIHPKTSRLHGNHGFCGFWRDHQSPGAATKRGLCCVTERWQPWGGFQVLGNDSPKVALSLRLVNSVELYPIVGCIPLSPSMVPGLLVRSYPYCCWLNPNFWQLISPPDSCHSAFVHLWPWRDHGVLGSRVGSEMGVHP